VVRKDGRRNSRERNTVVVNIQDERHQVGDVRAQPAVGLVDVQGCAGPRAVGARAGLRSKVAASSLARFLRIHKTKINKRGGEERRTTGALWTAMPEREKMKANAIDAEKNMVEPKKNG
jgi:hypothetical protein